MRQKSVKGSGIPDFSSEEEAFEWYESHEITDHLGQTSEVSPSSIFYQNATGQWFRALDGMLVNNIIEGKLRDIENVPQNQGRIIYELPLMSVPVIVLNAPTSKQRIQIYNQERGNFLVEGDKAICTLTTRSSATMLKLETK